MTNLIFQIIKQHKNIYIFIKHKKMSKFRINNQRSEITHLIFKYPKEHVTGLLIIQLCKIPSHNTHRYIEDVYYERLSM